MVIQVAAIAARRAALSVARKGAKRAAKKTVGEGIKARGDTTEKPSWLKILVPTITVLLFNDIPDFSEPITLFLAKLITAPIDVITSILNFIWFWFVLKDGIAKSLTKNFITLLIELVPGLGLIPTWFLLAISPRVGILNWIFNLPAKLISIFSMGIIKS